MLCRREALEVTHFRDDCQCGHCLNADEAGQLPDIFLIIIFRCKFFDTLVKSFQLVGEIIIGRLS